MNNKKYQKFKSDQARERKKDLVCRNELQRKIYDIATQDTNAISIGEFYTFYYGFTKCLELNNEQFLELKKLF